MGRGGGLNPSYENVRSYLIEADRDLFLSLSLSLSLSLCVCVCVCVCVCDGSGDGYGNKAVKNMAHQMDKH